jgi:hypothetical protein
MDRHPILCNALLVVQMDATIFNSRFNFLRVLDGLSNKVLFKPV